MTASRASRIDETCFFNGGLIHQSIHFSSPLLPDKVSSLEGGDGSVRLDRVNSSSFRKVLYWCAYHRDDADEPEKQFFRISQSSLLEILLAATYLAFSDLRDRCCRVLSDLNKRKQRGGFREILKLPSEEGQSSITE
ncbi:unnamed protein product [Hydatigera taeniaeformis]|uniref:BTB domain-containing protein n=1 Tax=Hydatigena taeniaeformis TaxID=6205 RepID=A0A0R3WL20_HYDTA|nr:unnamed protein product [Hydatigera taeniaeformis]